MTRHTYELAASTFGFLGGAVLSLEALLAVRRARSERGKKSVQEAVRKAQGVYVDDHDRVRPRRMRCNSCLRAESRSQAESVSA